MTLPERADYSLAESVFAPFPAEPAQAVYRTKVRLSGLDSIEETESKADALESTLR
jgi:hypothetical protein